MHLVASLKVKESSKGFISLGDLMRRASPVPLTWEQAEEMERKILTWFKMMILREGRVTLRSFGIFKVVMHRAKLVMTPGDGQIHRAEARRKVKFKTVKRWER